MAYILSSFFFISLHSAFGTKESFEQNLSNYNIYEVTAFTTRERDVLCSMHVRVNDMIFTNGVSNEAALPMDLLVEDWCTSTFESIMQANDIDFIKVRKDYLMKQLTAVNCDPIILKLRPITKEFHCYDNIVRWAKIKANKNPNLELIKLGETYEKRDIMVFRISSGKKKKCVFLMGGEEGKDWISVGILLNMIEFLLEDKLEILTYHYDFYILPLFNPDGYMYSIKKNRLWRKNTQIHIAKKPCIDNETDFGINVDRNWDFYKLSIRNEECDPIYAGSKPMSEQETISVSKFLNEIALEMMAFINVRGADNIITIPYAYNKEYCNNYHVLMDMLSATRDTLKKYHNVTFEYGPTFKYFYNFSGNSADWVKKHLNTPIVYTIYMKSEPYIFPSPDDIEPLASQFSTMITEILLLANTFYDPLFNNQMRHSNNIYDFTWKIILMYCTSKILFQY